MNNWERFNTTYLTSQDNWSSVFLAINADFIEDLFIKSLAREISGYPYLLVLDIGEGKVEITPRAYGLSIIVHFGWLVKNIVVPWGKLVYLHNPHNIKEFVELKRLLDQQEYPKFPCKLHLVK